MTKSYRVQLPGEGPNYDWSNDHSFVKVSAADTDGAYTLIEDNLKATFALGLHRHDQHAETFYVLEGGLDFYLDGDWVRAVPGTTIHVPAGVPHACRVANAAPAKMLMIMQPSGFDAFLAEMATMNPADFEDPDKMTALNAKYDIVPTTRYIIPLIMGLPLVAVTMIAGVFVAKRDVVDGKTLNVSLAVLLLLAPAIDVRLPYPAREQMVRSEIVIEARASVVWKNTLSIANIGDHELVWTFSHNVMGVPKPLSAAYDNGTRHLRWTQGVSLREIVIALEPNRRIAWDFDFYDQAALRAVDPHISPNSKFIRLRSGSYNFQPIAGGRTRLTLETQLDIATPLNLYFGPWAERILQDFHISVLNVIKQRSEAML